MNVFFSIVSIQTVSLIQKDASGLQRLDGPARAKVLAALAGLVLLGLGMMALTWLGARVTRRYMNPAPIRPQPRRGAPDHEDWAEKPLVDGDVLDASWGVSPEAGEDD